jgi:hypothetical protein
MKDINILRKDFSNHLMIAVHRVWVLVKMLVPIPVKMLVPIPVKMLVPILVKLVAKILRKELKSRPIAGIIAKMHVWGAAMVNAKAIAEVLVKILARETAGKTVRILVLVVVTVNAKAEASKEIYKGF